MESHGRELAAPRGGDHLSRESCCLAAKASADHGAAARIGNADCAESATAGDREDSPAASTKGTGGIANRTEIADLTSA